MGYVEPKTRSHLRRMLCMLQLPTFQCNLYETWSECLSQCYLILETRLKKKKKLCMLYSPHFPSDTHKAVAECLHQYFGTI